MKIQAHTVETKKVLAIGLLFLTSAAITGFGAYITVNSLINNVYFRVMTSDIPGAVFGAVITFLGIRYLLAVKKLKTEVFKTESKFSWRHFRKAK